MLEDNGAQVLYLVVLLARFADGAADNGAHDRLQRVPEVPVRGAGFLQRREKPLDLLRNYVGNLRQNVFGDVGDCAVCELYDSNDHVEQGVEAVVVLAMYLGVVN